MKKVFLTLIAFLISLSICALALVSCGDSGNEGGKDDGGSENGGETGNQGGSENQGGSGNQGGSVDEGTHTHTVVTDEAKAPTCTETGLTEGNHCSSCGVVLVEQKVVDALGHTEVVDEAVAPTCTETGLTEGKHCSVCEEILIEQETVKASGHSITEENKCSGCELVCSSGLIFTLSEEKDYYIVSGIGSCEEKNIYIPKTHEKLPVKSIGNESFSVSEIESIYIPDSITSIGDHAFKNCASLKSVVIPDSVTNVGQDAFDGCVKLSAVYISDIAAWCNISFKFGGNLNSNPLYLAKNLYFNGELVRELVIPDGVTSIGYMAFSGSDSIISVIIPDSVTSIGESAFTNCENIISVSIGDNLTNIGYMAFYDCDNLVSVRLGKAVKLIGDYAFENCNKLVEIINDSSLNIVSGSADYGYIGHNAKEIHSGESKIVNKDDYIFYTYGKTNFLLGYIGVDSALTLPESYNGEKYQIYKYAFYWRDDITSIVIPNSVTAIGTRAFDRSATIRSVYISDLTAWCKMTFEAGSAVLNGRNLYLNGELVKQLVIPEGVVEISDNAFTGCSSINSVVIPSSVKKIGNYTFSACSNIVEVVNHSSLNITAGSTLNGYIGKYAKEIQTENSKTVNKDGYLFYTFDEVNYLLGYVGEDTELTLPESYNGESYEIYKYAFFNLDDVISVIIPDSVTSIGYNAFYDCDSLTSVVIGNNVTSISDYAFYSCNSLTSARIGDSVTSIGNLAFYDCTSLKSIEIPDSVTGIGEDAFAYCDSLTSITVPFVGASKDGAENTHFGYIFGGSSYSNNASFVPQSLKSVIITGGFRIDDYSFYNCLHITDIVIPSDVTSIGKNAFFKCNGLESVVFNATSTWYVTTNSYNWQNQTGGTEIDVTDTSENATYLKGTYYYYYWYKK